jgi:peroxiredoxin
MTTKKFLPMFLILAFGLLAFHFTARTALPQAKNNQAPPFTLKLLNGSELKSSDLKGKVTVLKFVASYWPECRQEAPDVEKVYREFKDKDVQFVGIFVKDRESDVQNFVKKYGLSFPFGLDDGMKIANSYKFVGTPFTVVISKDGEISDRRTGPQSEQALRTKIEKLLKWAALSSHKLYRHLT